MTLLQRLIIEPDDWMPETIKQIMDWSMLRTQHLLKVIAETPNQRYLEMKQGIRLSDPILLIGRADSRFFYYVSCLVPLSI